MRRPDLIRKAIAINLDLPIAHSNFGNALSGLGRLDDAIAAYRNAIALDSGCGLQQINEHVQRYFVNRAHEKFY
jgi:tetratricopeptide (TPR) repeat protein